MELVFGYSFTRSSKPTATSMTQRTTGVVDLKSLLIMKSFYGFIAVDPYLIPRTDVTEGMLTMVGCFKMGNLNSYVGHYKSGVKKIAKYEGPYSSDWFDGIQKTVSAVRDVCSCAQTLPMRSWKLIGGRGSRALLQQRLM